MTRPFDISTLYRVTVPAPAPAWEGLPRFAFNSGHNDRDGIPVAALAEAATAVLNREGANLAVYNLGSGPLGYPPLRDFLAGKLQGRRGISTDPNNILITSGSGQGLELVNKLLLERGDTVILEGFTYAGALKKLKPFGVNVVSAPVDGDGLDIDALETILSDLAAKGTKPKYLYTIPTIQNPTGSILPLQRRKRLIALARQHGFAIFEDECYADIIWAGEETPPSLYALAPDITIHIGSFSKSLAPALRVGYIVAGAETIRQIVPLKTDGGTGALDQMVVAEYFSRQADTHITALTKRLRRKYEVMVEAVQREFGTSAELWLPKGGIFLWLRLPNDIDVRDLVKPAAALGVAFNPGPEWAVDGENAKNWLRLCFALPTEDEIKDGVRLLAQAAHATFGIPTHSANSAN
jgi:2-aminoadipate transaminase